MGVLSPTAISVIRAHRPDLSPARHGSKACGLQVLMEAGLAVPAAFVIEAPAVTTVARGGRIDELDAALDAISGGSPEVEFAVRAAPTEAVPGVFETVLGVARSDVRDAIISVAQSTRGLRAMTIARELGHAKVPACAVVVQVQVDSAGDDESGAGVAVATPVPEGEPVVSGPFAWTSGGGELGAGIVPVQPLRSIAERRPDLLAELEQQLLTLTTERDDPIKVEFAIERGRLWFLQIEAAGDAASTSPSLHGEVEFLAAGRPVSAGMGRGLLHVDVDDALDAIAAGKRVVLALRDTAPSDVAAIQGASALLTVLGSPESHAAIVSRAAGVPAVVSVQGLEVAEGHIRLAGEQIDVGRTIVVDGTAGTVSRPVDDS